MELLAEDPPLDLDDPRWRILPWSAQRPPARIADPARVEGSLVSPGCYVGGRVARSVLGPGVLVEEGATVRDSVVLNEAVVRSDAVVERAIVDADAEVGAGACVGDADGEITLVGQRARIPRDGVVEAGERIAPAASR